MTSRPVTPHVVLPWASVHWPAPALEGTDVGPAKARLGNHLPGRSSLPGAPAGARTSGSLPLGKGATYRPEPVVPDSHRRPLDDGRLNGAAVVLDVLRTWTGGVSARPTVLHELTELMAKLGDLDTAGPERRAQLMAFAASDVGATRALLARALDAHLAALAGAEAGAPSTPSTVAAALRRIELMAAHVVREARLLIEASDTTDYKQA